MKRKANFSTGGVLLSPLPPSPGHLLYPPPLYPLFLTLNHNIITKHCFQLVKKGGKGCNDGLCVYIPSLVSGDLLNRLTDLPPNFATRDVCFD